MTYKFFGASMPLRSVICYALGAIFCAAMLPVMIAEVIGDKFPEPFDVIISNILIVFAFPFLMCMLHKRKVFGRGKGSFFFRFYTIFYIFMGLFFLIMGIKGSEGTNLDVILMGVLMLVIGGTMFAWATKMEGEADEIVAQYEQDQAALAREDQINMQAEAIMRAEEMKRAKGL